MDGIPVVCVTGQVTSSMIGNDAFQEADTIGITRAVTKHNYLVKNVDDLPRIMVEAFRDRPIRQARPGARGRAQGRPARHDRGGVPGPVKFRAYRPQYEPQPRQIAKLAKAINAARRPVFLVGAGIIAAGAAPELLAVAHKANIPVTTTLMGLGAFPDSDPLALRMPACTAAWRPTAPSASATCSWPWARGSMTA